MARRDQLTYDVDQTSPRRSVPLVPLLILLAVVLVACLLVAGVVRSGGSPGAAAPPTAAPPVTVSASPVISSPLPSGTDADEEEGAPEGSTQAAASFVRAWLDPHPKTRKPALVAVSAPALTEELLLTDPENIPRAKPRGAPVLDEASAYSAQFSQTLSTGMKIEIYLVADPEARYRWLATSVEQA